MDGYGGSIYPWFKFSSKEIFTQGQHTSFIYRSIAWQNNVCIFNGQTLVSNLLKSAVQFVLRGIAGYLGANYG